MVACVECGNPIDNEVDVWRFAAAPDEPHCEGCFERIEVGLGISDEDSAWHAVNGPTRALRAGGIQPPRRLPSGATAGNPSREGAA